ncbi:MAG: pyridoxamine 5'-phosphate oxidase family protein [Alphaproteobacteria bacterium]
MTLITRIEDLEQIYGSPGPSSTLKELDRLIPEYQAYIEASPFCALATCGPEGLDCTPRGDRGSVVRIADDKTLLMPDRRGNNRIDSLRNIVRDPRVALMFLVPGSNTAMRVNGRASISINPDLLDTFVMEGKPPRSVIVIEIDAVYFQCARALMRGDVWNSATFVPAESLPSAGQMLTAASQGQVGGEAYDQEWPGRAKASMW